VRWAERYDRTLTDVFAVQEEIAQAVVRALPLHLGAAPEALVRPATANLAAYELYLKGKFAMYRVGPGDLRDAIGYFEQAVAVDPDFAAAYAWLAHAHLLTVVFGGLPAHGPMGLASGYADRAVALDSGSADAHWIRAMVAFLWTWDWGEAERAFERALALEPGHANARHIYAVYLHAQRRFAESREEIARALATDPLVVNGRLTLGRVLLSVGEVDGAIGHLREAVRMLPRSAFPRTCLGHAYFLAGRPDEALAEFERAVDTGLPAERAELAYAYARVGRRDDALSLVRALRAPEPGIYPPPYHLAIAYTGLGDPDEAFRWLDRAYDERAPALADRLLVEPALAPLRADPRFPQLARRLGLDARA
jgi:serine/threonine-protein kinase